MSGRFPKPAAPGRGDGHSFITGFGDAPQIPDPNSEVALPPPAEPVSLPEPELRGSVARRQPKPLKIPMTYKHRESSYKRLKKISQVLDVPMGDLIDEALDAKFADWEAEIRNQER
jgi:hypothetical protein